MKLVKKIIAILLSIGLGLIFIYSGYTKLEPVIETFEFTFVDIGIANWYTAPIIARLLISLEFVIGFLLLINYKLKTFTLKATIGVLLFFIIYLTIIILTTGNSGNCGCFGEVHFMTPLQAIIKNIIMIVMAIIVYMFYEGWSIRFNKLFISFISLVAITICFIRNPIDYSYTSNNLDEAVNYPLELNLLYQPEDTVKVEKPTLDLRKGKHVVAFMCLSCPHCRIAAKKFRLIKKNNPEISIYFVLNGDKNEKLKNFLDDTKATNIPYSFCLGKTFVQLASARLPRIYYLNNGIVERKVDYFELNQYEIENWMAGTK